MATTSRRKQRQNASLYDFFSKYTVPKEEEKRRKSLAPNADTHVSSTASSPSRSSGCSTPISALGASARPPSALNKREDARSTSSDSTLPTCPSPSQPLSICQDAPDAYAPSDSKALPTAMVSHSPGDRRRNYTLVPDTITNPSERTPQIPNAQNREVSALDLFKSGTLSNPPSGNECNAQEPDEDTKPARTSTPTNRRLATSQSTQSSPLSAPPSSRLSSTQSSFGSSRERKRPHFVRELHIRRGSEASSEASSTLTVSPSPTVRLGSNDGKMTTSQDGQTSSLSPLSTTPGPSNLSQTSLQPMQSQVPPTSSLSALSATPVPPIGFSSQRQGPVGDSQSSDDSEDDVLEVERVPEPSMKAKGAYCALPSDSERDSLEDADVMLGTKKKDTFTPASIGRRSQPASNSFRERPYEAPKSIKREPKYSLKRLLRDHQKEEKYSSRVQEAEARLKASEAAGEDNDIGGCGSALASLVDHAEDEEQAAKLRLVMERQELLTHDVVWHFFGGLVQEDTSVSDLSALCQNLSGEIWSKFRDREFCDQAFLSGFATDLLTAQRSIPRGVLEHLWQATICEPREELAEVYRCTLEALAQRAGPDLSLTSFTSSLKRMGATQEAVTLTAPLKRSFWPMNKPTSDSPKHLRRLLRATRVVAAHLPSTMLPSTLCLFLRLGIDRVVNESLELLPELQAIIGNLIEASRSENPLGDLGASIVSSVTLPVLQRRLLAVIPDVTPLPHEFKRRLALSFFLSSADFLAQPLNDAGVITHRIKMCVSENAAFDLRNESSDYSALTASINILDIAISAGFGPPIVSHPNQSAEAQKTTKQAVKIFDTNVDQLISGVNVLYTQIQDTGASHMLRTTAKSTIQNLVLRLEFGVRTRPPPGKDVLGGIGKRSNTLKFGTLGSGMSKKRRAMLGGPAEEEEEQEKQASIMERFWEQKKRMKEKSESPRPTADGTEERLKAGPRSKDSKQPPSVTRQGARPATPSPSPKVVVTKSTPKSDAPKPTPKPQQSPAPQVASTYQKFLERKKKTGFKSPLSGDLNTQQRI